ncbi:MAG: cation transporter [Coleofasciculaceae cyanobacterium]
MTEGQNRAKTGRLILLITLWVTLLILSIKVSAAWATRSLSLMAESLHTLLTSFSTLLSLLTIVVPDQRRQRSVYGHGKRETTVTLLFVAFLGFAGLNLLAMSTQHLATFNQGEALNLDTRATLPLIQLLGVVVVTSLGLALLDIYEAKVLSNRVLRFNANQLLKDVWLTILVLGGLVGVWLWDLAWLDAVLAVLLVILAMGSCWKILNWHLPLFVKQTAIAPEMLARIASQVRGVTHCYQIQSRGMVGRLVYVQMHLIVHPDFAGVRNLIAQQIERLIQERYGPAQVALYIDDFAEQPSLSQYYLMPGDDGT